MARVKLAYPKILGSGAAPLEQCIAFEKYDGTNIHWVWDRELGWHAFGMRRNRYDLDEQGIADFHMNHEGYENLVEIFQNEFASKLDSLFKSNTAYSCDEIFVFTEFLGAESFAGAHKPEDPKQLVLFDVQTESGMTPPNQFVEDFSEFNIARVVYRGKLTGKFANDVREGKYDVNEGVICKGGKTSSELWMVKIKTNAYMARLKQVFKDGWDAYWE